MGRKRFTAEQIINILREGEVLLNQDPTVGAVYRKLGISEQIYYRWRKDYGGMRADQAKRLKELEKENARLKWQESWWQVSEPALCSSSPGVPGKMAMWIVHRKV